MRRLAAAALVLLFIAVPGQPAASDGATIVWDSDRVIGSVVAIDENDTLVIPAGVNLSFEPDASDQAGENDTRPILAVLGRLQVNGTYDERVWLAANESLWSNGGEPDCLYIYSDGRPDRFSVRNASFTDIIINVDGAGGEFSDCVFERCDVLVAYSAVSIVNCTFIYSVIGTSELPGQESWPSGVTVRGCQFDGRAIASYPPMPYNYAGYGTDDLYPRTAIGLWPGARIEGCTISGYATGIQLDLNSSSVQNCEIRDCRNGMTFYGNFQNDSAEVRGSTVQNCTGTGIYAWGRLTLTDTVIGDCGSEGLESYGDLLMANCTVYGCPTGVFLGRSIEGAHPDWLLTGNRIFGCDGYAVSAVGQDVDLAGNRFDNGNVTNGEGRLQVSSTVRLRVVDPLGYPVSGACDLAWTDSSGATGGQSSNPGYIVSLTESTIDNDGVRIDRFPYDIRIRMGTIENRTALPAGQRELRVVLQILPDLVPVYLSTDFESVSAGQDVSFLVRVENLGAGIAWESTVTFLVDGAVVDRKQVSPTAIRGTSSVYSDPWRATPGRHTLEARVDAPGLVRENNETNNNMTVQFNVSGYGPSPLLELTHGASYFLVLLLLVVIFAVVFGAGVALAHRRRRRRQTDGTEPAPATGLEPTPATIPGAAQIKCPRCGRVNEVVSRVRPLEVECDICRSRLRLEK